jgi:hypothetical protein
MMCIGNEGHDFDLPDNVPRAMYDDATWMCLDEKNTP